LKKREIFVINKKEQTVFLNAFSINKGGTKNIRSYKAKNRKNKISFA
jgi:hypothetical protein